MTAVAIKGLATRKARAALTAVAIVLGVAMVSGTLVMTDTVSKAFDNLFTENYKGTSAVVSGRNPNLDRQGKSSPAPPVAASLLEKIRALPSVTAAAGAISQSATLVGRDGKTVQSLAPTFLYGYDFKQPRFVPLEIASGKFPSGRDEVALDEKTASDQGFRIGDRVKIVAHGPARSMRLSGTARYKTVSSIGGAVVIVTDVPTAQALSDKRNQLDSISAAGGKGLSDAQVAGDIRRVVPASAVVRTAADQAAQAQDDQGTKSLTSILRTFLLAFGGISLFVGAFVIFNTLSITIAQRTRELATLRTLGATRRQVLRSVLLEALVLGGIASVVGLFAGLALEKALEALLGVLGIDLPATTTVFALRTVIASLLVGIVVTLLAGLAPAVRSTRVPPILAVREGATLPASRLSRVAPLVAGLAVLVATALLVLANAVLTDITITQRLLLDVAGCLVLFLGIALVSSRFVGWLALVIGWPSSRFGGVPGELARHNSRRNPARVAATAGALTVGLALVTFVAVLGAAIKESNKAAINRQVRADYVVSSGGRETFQTAAADALAKARGIAYASSVRSDSVKVRGASGGVNLTAVDPATITQVYRFQWIAGSDAALAQLGDDGAIVSDDFAKSQSLKRGERFRMITPRNRTIRVRVVAIYRSRPLAPLLGAVTISQAAYARSFDPTATQYDFLRVRGGPSADERRALERVLAPFPDAKLKTKGGFIEQQASLLNTLLNVVFLLLALAIIVSVCGIVNTLALSVFERTRELGMLRAVGMIRRQIRTMILHESIIIALIGGALGMAIGLFLGAIVSSALGSYDVSFQVPLPHLAIFLAVALIAGLLASILPARRAARLDVLQALHYE